MKNKNPDIATDPICGMAVSVTRAKKEGLHMRKNEEEFYFCSSNCKNEFGSSWFTKNKLSIILTTVLLTLTVFAIQLGVMRKYMGLLLIVLALLQLQNLKGFATMFAKYDIIAARSKKYAIAYPFLEIMAGLLFLFNTAVPFASLIVISTYGPGTVGVAKHLASGKKTELCVSRFRDNYSLELVHAC